MNIPRINKTTLDNYEVKQLKDKYENTYFLIVDNSREDTVYFAFKRSVTKDGWETLTKFDNSLQLEIDYTESEKNDKLFRTVVDVAEVMNI